MALLDGKQIRNQSISLNKVSDNGTVTFTTATVSFDTGAVLRQSDANIITGLDVVNKNYVDAVATGLHIKEAVVAISITPITLSGTGSVVDGWTLSLDDRILVNGQAGTGVATSSNGIYVVSGASWTRATDSDGNPNNEVSEGDFVFVRHGDTYQSTGWVLSITDAVDHTDIQVGTESQLWVQFSDSGNIVAGDGLIQIGQDFAVNTGTGLTISSDQVIIDNTGVTAGSYGDANTIPTFTVNAQGQLTLADQVDVNITASQVSDFNTAAETAIFTDANFVDGITITFSVTSGDSVTAEVVDGSLTASKLDIINSASASQGWKLGYNTTGQFEWFDPTLSDISAVVAGSGLTGGGDSGSVTLDVNTTNGISIVDDSVALGGTLTQNTTIDGGGFDLTISGVEVLLFTSSVFDVEADGLISLDAGTGSVQILADDTITISASSSVDLVSNGSLSLSFDEGSVTDNSGNGLGLVYTADYTGTFVTNSLVTKAYVESVVNSMSSGVTDIVAGSGLSGGGTGSVTLDVNVANGLQISGDNVEIAPSAAGNGLTFSAGVFDISTTNGIEISGDAVGLASTVAGDGLTYSSGILSVNVANGLQIADDSVEINPAAAGDGLTFSTGVFAVNVANGLQIADDNVEINPTAAGDGLTFSAGVFSVNVNSESLEITSDTIRLKDTITGNRTFTNTVTIQGDLIVEGTQSIINTENIFIEDNIITLNATYSGPYNVVDAGIEVNLGGGTFAALIWDASESLWAVGFSGSTSTIITEAGTGLTKSGDTISIDTAGFSSTLAGNGLTANGSQIDVQVSNGLIIISDVVQVNETIAGDGLTFSAGVLNITTSNGLTILNDSVQVADTIAGDGLTFSAGVINIQTSNGLTIISDEVQVADTIAGDGLTFSAGVISVLVSGGLTVSNDEIQILDTIAGDGLTFSAGVLNINTDNGLSIVNDSVALGGTLTQNTTIDGGGFDLTIGGAANISMTATSLLELQVPLAGIQDGQVKISMTDIGTLIYTGDISTFSQIDVKTGSLILDSGAGSSNSTITLTNESVSIGDGSTGNYALVNDTLGSKGLVYEGDYTANFTTYSLVTKGYVDSKISAQAQPEYSQRNLTPSATTIDTDNEPTGLTLSYTPNDFSRVNVYVNGSLQFLGNGTSSSVDCYFSNDSGVTARLITALETGDELYWNGSSANAGFKLDTTDRIDIIYER